VLSATPRLPPFFSNRGRHPKHVGDLRRAVGDPTIIASQPVRQLGDDGLDDGPQIGGIES
jgi:hypothetical protein